MVAEDESDGTSTSVYDKFISICRKCISKDDESGMQILQKIEERFRRFETTVAVTNGFVEMLELTCARLRGDPSNVFVYIKDVNAELLTRMPKKVSSKSSLKTTGNNGSVDENSAEGFPADSSEKKKASDKHIRKLERLLGALNGKVQRLQEKEMSVDDMQDSQSSYVLEDRYQKRALQVWKKLCELKGTNDNTGRNCDQKFRYNGTGYPEIDKRVSTYVNKYKEFPDYQDILHLVTHVSEKKEMHLSAGKLESLARSVFTGVGEQLRARRLRDFHDLQGCHLTDVSMVDPADEDTELATTLEQSYTSGKQKIEDLVNEFAQKQIDLGETLEKIDEADDDDAVAEKSSPAEKNDDEGEDRSGDEGEDRSGGEGEDQSGGEDEEEDDNDTESELGNELTIQEISLEFEDEVENTKDDEQRVEESSSSENEDQSDGGEESSSDSNESTWSKTTSEVPKTTPGENFPGTSTSGETLTVTKQDDVDAATVIKQEVHVGAPSLKRKLSPEPCLSSKLQKTCSIRNETRPTTNVDSDDSDVIVLD